MPRRAARCTDNPALSIPSSTDGSGAAPDASLLADDGIVATSHRGLTYPLGEYGPGEGDLRILAPGVGWARIAMPGSLGHINVWLLDDSDAEGAGVAIVDTGMNLPTCRASWEALFAGPLAGRRVTRVIATHLHPDHVGLAGWLCDRFGVDLWMTRTEWLLARLLSADARPEPPREAIAAWRAAGWSDDQIATAASKGWGRFSMVVSPLPAGHVRFSDGDEIAIGQRRWRIIVGSGHTPEHACLWNEEAGLLISGDQVLPRITSNVSLTLHEPHGDPLGDWLASIDRLLSLPADLLVLPAHGEPFTGLHTRLKAMRDEHLARLTDLATHLAQPRTAVECFPVLFHRELSDNDLLLGTGEAMAHLRYLEVRDRARRRWSDGVARFEAA